MEQNSYDFQVGLKYQLYNSIFLTLHFDTIKQTGIELPVFRAYLQSALASGKDPLEIIEQYFKDHKESDSIEERNGLLFRFIQYVERQVVLIDSLEEAAFSKLNDLNGAGSLHQLIERVKIDHKEIELQEALNDFRVKIVLTAHPTQFYPGAVLGIINDLSASVEENDLHEIRMLLEQLGQTPFFKKEKPLPYNEAVSLGWYLENIFYHSIPQIVSRVKGFASDIDYTNFRLLEVGFWPGGDRDGNPFVSVETTKRVAKRLKFLLLKAYYKDVRDLKRRLTFNGVVEIIDALEDTLRTSLFESNRTFDFDLKSFQNDLLTIKTLLEEKYQSFFIEKVEDLLIKTKIFGQHFSALDIRQDSRVLQKGFDICTGTTEKEIKQLSDYFTLSFPMPGETEGDAVHQDLFKVFNAIGEIQQENGELACHRFIISNCRRAESILQVYAMANNLGLKNTMALDIVPLFETIDDLMRSQDEMERLYQLKEYQTHLKRRGGRQYIMLGFSDGTKDGGYFSANWNIYKAKERMTDISRQYGVEVVFFDGRGGPPARGGGNVRKYYAAQGNKIENKEVQLTIQGQTVSSRFSSVAAASHYLENILTAGMESRLYANDHTTSPKQEALMQQIADDSLKAYVDLKEREDFMSFLEFRSPLKYFGQTNIGSRPSKRGKSSKLTLDDLRAIPFVGSWSTMKLNVPGYYGLGKAMEKSLEKVGEQELIELYQQNEFFASLVSNSMQSLSKTRMELTAYLQKDETYKALWKLINDENNLTKAMIQKLLGDKGWEMVLESKHSIQLREEIVLPLLIIQQYALIKMEQSEAHKTVYEKLIIRTLYGIINAARNSA
ncbi:MAG: phosphoenolpyruvate carboxylase [Chitinophagales bacterium]